MKYVGIVICLITLLLSIVKIPEVIAKEPITLEYWSYQALDKANWPIAEKMIAEFEKKNPDIKVKVIPVDWGEIVNKTLVATTGGNPPDLADMWSMQIPGWVEQGLLTNLDPYVKNIDWKQFAPAALSLTKYKGSQWAIPMGCDSYALIYNKDRFKESGLNPDKGPRTIEELDRFAEKLYKIDDKGNIVRCGFAPWFAEDWGWNWIAAFGGEIWDEKTQKIVVNHPRNIATLEWYDSYMKKYGREKMLEYMTTAAAGYGGRAISDSPIYTGEIAMFVAGDWYPKFFIELYRPDLNYGVVPLPYPPGGRKNSSEILASVTVIPKGAKHPDEAFKFLKFFWIDNRPFTVTAGTDIPISNKWMPYFKKMFPKVGTWANVLFSPNAFPLPMIPAMSLPNWGGIITARDYVLHGKKTPKQALDDLTIELQREMDKYIKK
jgi:multiple sugar transport system substrate-binding protein